MTGELTLMGKVLKVLACRQLDWQLDGSFTKIHQVSNSHQSSVDILLIFIDILLGCYRILSGFYHDIHHFTSIDIYYHLFVSIYIIIIYYHLFKYV